MAFDCALDCSACYDFGFLPRRFLCFALDAAHFCLFSMPQHPPELLGGWRNQVCARVGAMVGLYSPIKVLPEVRCEHTVVDTSLCNADVLRSVMKRQCGYYTMNTPSGLVS